MADEEGGGPASPTTEMRKVQQLASMLGLEKTLKLVSLFQSGFESGLRSLRDGIAEMDREQIVADAHRMKGVAQQIGANELAELCKLLEKRAHDLEKGDLEQIYEGFSQELATVNLNIANAIEAIKRTAPPSSS